MKIDINKEYKELCQLVDEHKVISFDIYDTALLRNVLHPTDIFDIVCRKLEKEKILLRNFKKIRIMAEKKARENSKFEDIGINDIYKQISKSIGQQLSDKIKQIELSTEQEFTISNIFIKKIYNYARNSNKTVLFISDMYLPKAFISQLLVTNGFQDYAELFVSGSVGVSKASSNLFRYVRNQMNIDGPWLHVGDNLISDYNNAINNHIDAYYYKKPRDRIDVTKKYCIQESIIKAIQINYSETNETLNYWNKFGINIVSSLFFGFTLWLTDRLSGKDNVYFLSRDGYLPYQLFKKMNNYVEGLPRAVYLYASRRAYQIPNILNMRKEDGLELLTSYNRVLGQNLTLGEIFENLNLNKETYTEIIGRFGFLGFQDKIDSEQDRSRAKEVLNFIYSDIVKVLQYEIFNLKAYLKQNKVFKFEELNIVDVGWRGSTQKAISDITKIKTNGYYFGTNYNVYDNFISSVNGYAFNLGRPRNIKKKIMDNVMMYEFIFSAPHGSLVGFKKENEGITPILKDIEKNNYLLDCLKNVHSSVMDITERYLIYYEYLKDMNYTWSVRDYIRFIDTKKYDDLMEFSKLTGVVGIGNSHFSQNYVTCVSIREYFNNKKIEQEINRNLWKGALIVRGSISELKKRNYMSILLSEGLYLKEMILKIFKNPKKAVKLGLKKINSKFIIHLKK